MWESTKVLLLLNVWPTSRSYCHHLGACWKWESQTPFHICWIRIYILPQSLDDSHAVKPECPRRHNEFSSKNSWGWHDMEHIILTVWLWYSRVGLRPNWAALLPKQSQWAKLFILRWVSILVCKTEIIIMPTSQDPMGILWVYICKTLRIVPIM